MVDLFKDILPSIMKTKSDLSEDPDFDKSYKPFVINRSLSYHYDCVLQANQVNFYSQLPKKLQYHFLLNTIRGYKRPFQKWQKRETIEDIEAISEYYNYSYEKAKDALSLLTDDQKNEIRKLIEKGGSYDSKPRRRHF